jgi:tetratricopeptide (TPR) repeat protein
MKLLMTIVTLSLALALGTVYPAAQRPERFDDVVREDFFAGFAGDAERLAKGMATCERVLAENPAHAEAMVWHGTGLLAQAGAAFNAGDQKRGAELWARGLGETDKAVSLAPNNPGVLIPRAAVLLQATRAMPENVARPLIASALANYERVLELQKDTFQSLGDHPKGELLFGLAEGYARLGDLAAARRYFERLVVDAPGSGQAPRARTWLESGSLPSVGGLGCVGCHK